MTHNFDVPKSGIPDFDVPVDRKGTGSLKWDFRKEFAGREDVIPLWVADMDFPAPPAVRDALIQRASHGIYGYTLPLDSYYDALSGWYESRFGYSVKRKWVVISPGIVPALNMAVHAYTEPGDGVIIQNPVYYPFTQAVVKNGRKLLVNSLLEEEGRYSMNFEEFEAMAAEAKLFFLCSPHNPCGRVWTREELRRIGDICLKNDVIVLADEIHGDLIMPGFRHYPYPAAVPDAAPRMLLCSAPSKTFNVPGLSTSNIIIPDAGLRAGFQAALDRSGIELSNYFGVTAAEAAYRGGAPWLSGVIAYIHSNYLMLTEFLKESLPEVTVSPLESTYLAWLDCRPVLHRLNMNSKGLKRFLIDKAGVWIEAGSTFGDAGEGFMRINIACPKQKLTGVLERIGGALGGKEQ